MEQDYDSELQTLFSDTATETTKTHDIQCHGCMQRINELEIHRKSYEARMMILGKQVIFLTSRLKKQSDLLAPKMEKDLGEGQIGELSIRQESYAAKLEKLEQDIRLFAKGSDNLSIFQKSNERRIEEVENRVQLLANQFEVTQKSTERKLEKVEHHTRSLTHGVEHLIISVLDGMREEAQKKEHAFSGALDTIRAARNGSELSVSGEQTVSIA